MRLRAAQRAALGVTLFVIVAVLLGLLGDDDSDWSHQDRPYSGWKDDGHNDALEQSNSKHDLTPHPIAVDSLRGGKNNQTSTGIIELQFMGRLGNNLFEYAVARTVADRLGWALSLRTHRGNPTKYGTLLRPEGMACFPGVRGFGPASTEMRDLPQVEIQHVAQLKTEMDHPAAFPRRLVLQGWFQNYLLFSSNKDRLREIMALHPSCCGDTAPAENDLVIHYRNYKAELTDELYAKLLFKDLDFTFYDNILREIISSSEGPPETVWIVGEFDEDDALVTRLQVEHKNIRKAKNVDNQFNAFCFLMRAQRLVMAHSTFSWWSAFLGNATEVHFPLQNRGVTTAQVAVTDEPRYVYRDARGKRVSDMMLRQIGVMTNGK